MSGRPFARHYYVDLERDYPAVWWDDHLYATFGRLLAVAESMWPATPEIPRSAKAPVVQRLIASGLVLAVPPYSFRIKGMDAERTARSTAARTAAGTRWGTANGNAPAMPSQPASQANQRARSAPKNGSATMTEAFAKLGMPVDKP